MIILNRRQLTEALRDDWKDHVEDPGKKCEDSIIFRYFENTRNLAARRIPFEDIDKYVKGIEKERIRRQYGSYTLRKACEYRRGELGEEAYQSVCDEIKGTDRTLLRGLITDFFRNESVAETRKRGEEKPGYIDILDLARYYREMTDADGEPAARAADAENDPEYITKCEELYEEMKKRKNLAGACLPLLIDRKSGAGVFILGREYFSDEIATNRHCYPCVLAWGEYGADDICFYDDPQNASEDDIYAEKLTPFPVSMYPKVFSTVADAFGYFSRITTGEDYSEDSPFYAFRSNNVGFPMEHSERYREFELYFEEELKPAKPTPRQKSVMDRNREKEAVGIQQMLREEQAAKEMQDRIRKG